MTASLLGTHRQVIQQDKATLFGCHLELSRGQVEVWTSEISTMMSPTMQMPAPGAPYTPTSDAMDRHEYGITKHRKTASTGGGRAWSEDEVCGNP